VSDGGRGKTLAGSGYAGEVVAALAALRSGGVSDLDRAWSTAIGELPAPWSWRPRRAYRGEAPLVFLERQCRRAWDGEAVGHDLRSLAND
jgi:hypothetical protein